MMMPAPKGLEYWIDGPDGTVLASDAPDWAKKEFQQYMSEIDNQNKSDSKVIKR